MCQFDITKFKKKIKAFEQINCLIIQIHLIK